jgi:hypothetical protein
MEPAASGSCVSSNLAWRGGRRHERPPLRLRGEWRYGVENRLGTQFPQKREGKNRVRCLERFFTNIHPQKPPADPIAQKLISASVSNDPRSAPVFCNDGLRFRFSLCNPGNWL